MTDRPTLYLAGLQARTLHGPGRKLCAMALPRRWEHGDGRVSVAAPFEDDLRAVQATGNLAAYRAACERRWSAFAEMGRYDPGVLYLVSVASGEEDGRAHTRPVADGDTLFCACAAPDSPRRTHPCHLEILAPFLVRAGSDVVLWGRRMTLETHDEAVCCGVGVPSYGERECCGNPECHTVERVIWADTGREYDPVEFGWPEVGP